MKEIEGKPKNLKLLLLNNKYTIHYYQREYMWGRKQIEELLDDLTSEFYNYYKEGDSRQIIPEYGGYFMGSVVLAGRENAIIDGQQRLSSLTLLLIYLKNKVKEKNLQHEIIDGMIYSTSFGIESFNINIEERETVLKALYNNEEFKDECNNESVTNIFNRYCDINELFPTYIIDNCLLNFIDWLIEKVFFIEIVAKEEQDAHKVFVSMNDRGLSLTPTEMLKGYLLSEITDDKTREECNDSWKTQVVLLKEIDKAEDETFIKNWLRAKYATTIRDTKANATPMDFDNIGSGFHKWVRENRPKLGLKSSDDFKNLIDEFVFFSNKYIEINKYENNLSKDDNYKYIYYNAQLGFTFQMQLLLASIKKDDDDDIISKKINLVSKYIDMYIYSRAINNKSCDYNTIRNKVFRITNEIRDLDIKSLSNKLIEYVETSEQKFDTFANWEVNGYTKKYIKHLLARITGFIEEKIDKPSDYVNYVNIYAKDPFEVEHITCDHYEWFQDIYSSEQEFISFRNNIGDLVLLPKSLNASLNDEKYDYKLKKYISSNILAASLGKITYDNNPRFKKYKEENNLNFEAYDSFGKDEIIKRRNLYKSIVDKIWNVNNLRIN